MADPDQTDASHQPERRQETRSARARQQGLLTKAGSFFHELGPGLITGAADDDPSGIATYSQAGAAFGYGLLWTAVLTLPLMAAVQFMCARIGIVANAGLASVLRKHYSRWLLWFACLLLLLGNTINIAADLGGMAAAATLLTGIPAVWFVPVFTLLILGLLIYASYELMTRVLKWMTLVLFAYVFAAVLAHPNWWHVLRGTFLPSITLSKNYILTFVALLGTTISPYLFFWQAAQNAEQEEHLRHRFPTRHRRALQRELRSARRDVNMGMFISNMIMYFIILTAGATLHRAGITDVQTASQAATALRPIAGPLASWLFSFGLIGTGMLGVPVLAGSAAYAVAEAASWKRGMDETIHTASHFYGVIGFSMLIGMVLAFGKANAIKLLFWSAVANGLLAPPLIVIILIVCNNQKVMHTHKNGPILNLLGGAAALLMTGAAVGLLVS
jgi:NRAMP (natural resistance-associated macrophage protein)-like metal ion transporter